MPKTRLVGVLRCFYRNIDPHFPFSTSSCGQAHGRIAQSIAQTSISLSISNRSEKPRGTLEGLPPERETSGERALSHSRRYNFAGLVRNDCGLIANWRLAIPKELSMFFLANDGSLPKHCQKSIWVLRTQSRRTCAPKNKWHSAALSRQHFINIYIYTMRYMHVNNPNITKLFKKPIQTV